MAPKSDMSTPEMTRITVRVPQATLSQINDWVDTLGVRRSHFLGIALVAGARALIRASALDLSLRPEGGDAAGQALDEAASGQTPGSPEADLASLRAEVAQLREQMGMLLRSIKGSEQPSGS
jgi:hypothetical protein